MKDFLKLVFVLAMLGLVYLTVFLIVGAQQP
jgi:hypothetical protein